MQYRKTARNTIIIICIVLSMFLIPNVPPAHANPGLSVDVSRAVYCTDANFFTNTCSITNTVSSKGELMFVFVGIQNFLSATPGVFSIVDTQGDTFTARNYTLPVYTQTHQAFREYVATSSSASSGSITVNSTRVFQWTMFFVAIKGNGLLLDCAVGGICNPSTGIAGPGGGTNPQNLAERYMHGSTMFIQALNLHNVNTGTTIFSSTCANNGCIVGAQVQKITTPCCAGSGPVMKGAIQTSSQQVANPGMSWNSTENYVGVINDAVFENNKETPSQIQMFRDDFNYANQMVDSAWSLDIFYNVNSGSGSATGIWTYNNFMNIRTSNDPSTKTWSLIASTHLINPAWSSLPTPLVQGVRRQLTVALYPFDIKDSSDNAWVRVGFAPLITNGTYPTLTPPPYNGAYGDVNSDANQDCGTVASPNMSKNIKDFYGIEYLDISDKGTVVAVSCSPTGFQRTTITTVDPTLYTVVTIEYFNSVTSLGAGNSWVYYSMKQQLPDNTFVGPYTLNVTDNTKISPAFQTNYVFVGQFYKAAAPAAYVTSKIGLVQLQTYEGPVSLAVPPPLCSYNCPSQGQKRNTIGDWIFGIGGFFGGWLGGNATLGVYMFFFIISTLAICVIGFSTRSSVATIMTAILILGVFTYGGVFEVWTLIPVAFMDAGLVGIIVRYVIFGTQSAPRSEVGAE